MSFDACAALVEKADPDRFRTALLAPPAQRGGLLALYAFNIEVSRAPWVTEEAMIAEMRLQWWVDAIDEIYAGKQPRSHEIVGPLAETIGQYNLPRAPFDALIQARRADIYTDPPADRTALEAYVDATSSGLMWLAAGICAKDAALVETPVRQVGYAHGIANLFVATPELLASGRQPFPTLETAQLSQIAFDALARLTSARTKRRDVPAAMAPALLAAWQSGAILQQVARDPDTALQEMQVAPFRKRWTLLLRGMTGRW